MKFHQILVQIYHQKQVLSQNWEKFSLFGLGGSVAWWQGTAKGLQWVTVPTTYKLCCLGMNGLLGLTCLIY